MLDRSELFNQFQYLFTINPVLALLGPRQCGKTTLSRVYAKNTTEPVHYFDLEDPRDLAALDNPMLALSDLTGLIIIDEIQLRPDLFPVLRVLVDEHKARKFLILGSASRDLINQSSETLAGRISYFELSAFTLKETKDLDTLWVRGGFPRSYLAQDDQQSFVWRQQYIQTFLERDIPSLGFNVPPRTMGRFWRMLAHYHGQIFNASEIGRSLGIAHTTAKNYLDILTGTFMLRELTPWHENISKRQVRSAKIYFRDSGIFHSLVGLDDQSSLRRHPKLGASWEGLALEQVVNFHQVRAEDCYFWSVHSQCELDLLLFLKADKYGFEFKYSDAPKLSKSMIQSAELLQLKQLTVIYPGNKRYSLADNITVVPLLDYLEI